jgi:ABC-type glycerol-3-phosphate transport system substrate-binding protein
LTAKTVVGVSLVALAAICCLVISEKSANRQASANRVDITYWEKWNGPEEQAMRRIVNEYNASQDKIHVEYLTISGVDVKTLLSTSGGDPPDVAGIWLENLAQFGDANMLTDLTDMAAKVGLTKDYYIANYWDTLNYNGRLYAFPSTPASLALHVRPDLVPAQYASPQTFPTRLDEFDRLMFSVTQKDADGKLKQAGFMPTNPGWWHWSWPYLFGGKLFDGKEITIDTPESLRAFNWCLKYADFLGKDSMTEFQSAFGNNSSPQDPFMEGKVVTEFNGVWKGQYIRNLSPHTPWFAVPLPYPDDRPDLKNHTELSEDILIIPTGAKHVKEAFDFLKFVQSQPEMEELCKAQGKNSPLNKVSDKFYKDHPNAYIHLFDQLARSPTAIYAPKIGVFPQLRSEMDDVFQEITTGQKTPKKALHDAQIHMTELWHTYRRQVLGEPE